MSELKTLKDIEFRDRLNYKERFEKSKDQLYNIKAISKVSIKGILRLILNDLKSLQDEIKANGCGLCDMSSTGKSWTHCGNMAGWNCPTCQNLIKQIEEMLK